MPRSDPSRSQYCAARHLLRKLTDGKELCRNPIIRIASNAVTPRSAVQIAQSILYRTLAAMDELGANVRTRERVRHSAILFRCDVLHEDRKAVARDLGLSLPHFERERRAAMTRFIECLMSSIPPIVQAVTDVDFVSLECEQARRLADAGDPESARRLLNSIVRNTHDPAIKCRALLCESDVETEDHEGDRAARLLSDVQMILDRGGLDQRVKESIERRRLASDLRRRRVFLGPGSTVNADIKIADLPAENASIDILLVTAEDVFGAGLKDKAIASISRARVLASQLKVIDPNLAIDLPALEGMLSFWTGGDEETMKTGCREAWRLADHFGYGGRSLITRFMFLTQTWKIAQDRNARASARALADRLARLKLSKDLRLQLLIHTADSENAFGDPWRAATAAREAVGFAASEQDKQLINSILSRALARGGRIIAAERYAIAISRQPISATTGQAVLHAKRTLADIARLRRDSRGSRKLLSDALDIAHTFGSAKQIAELSNALAGLSTSMRYKGLAPNVNRANQTVQAKESPSQRGAGPH